MTTYSWTDATTPQSKMSVTLRGDTISAGGFALDSVAADLSYLKPNGTIAVRVRQNDQRDVALRGDFTLDKARNELRLADVSLRFDTIDVADDASIHRALGHDAASRWRTSSSRVVRGVASTRTGCCRPKGTANFDLQISDFAVENIAELLQSDLPITGRVNLDAHIEWQVDRSAHAGDARLREGEVQRRVAAGGARERSSTANRTAGDERDRGGLARVIGSPWPTARSRSISR